MNAKMPNGVAGSQPARFEFKMAPLIQEYSVSNTQTSQQRSQMEQARSPNESPARNQSRVDQALLLKSGYPKMNLLPEFEYEHRVDSIVSSIRGSHLGDGDEALVFLDATERMHRQRDQAEEEKKAAPADQELPNHKHTHKEESMPKKEKKKIKIQQKQREEEKARQMSMIENVLNVRGADAFQNIQKKHNLQNEIKQKMDRGIDMALGKRKRKKKMTEGAEWRVQDPTLPPGYGASASGDVIQSLLGLGKKNKLQYSHKQFSKPLPRGIKLLQNLMQQGKLKLEQKSRFSLSNQFNELTLVQQLKKAQQEEQTRELQQELMVDIEKQKMRRKINFKRVSMGFNSLGGPFDNASGNPNLDGEYGDADIDDPFYEHWDVDQVIPQKCIAAVCKKLRYQRFLMRQIPKEALNIQMFANSEIKGMKVSKTQPLNTEATLMDDDIIKSWMDIQPQIPSQNFVNCYGITRIKENFYMITDLVQDDEFLPSQKAEIQRRMTLELHSKEQYEEFQRSQQNNNYRGPSDFKISKNMFDLIKSMDLGNLSALDKIPDYYVQMLLGYIIQISRAFAHTHSHGLVHGNFNLSKVIAQKFTTNSELVKKYTLNKMKKQNHQTLFDNRAMYNYFLVNFEPWQVESLMQRQMLGKNSIFKSALKVNQLSLDVNEFKQIVKIVDLQAFGNSIIDILVGKNRQTDFSTTNLDQQNHDQSASRDDLNEVTPQKVQTKLGRSITGGIALENIPINWSKKAETTKIFDIIQKCLGPYGPNNNFQDLHTDKVFNEINKIALDTYEHSFGKFQDNFTYSFLGKPQAAVEQKQEQILNGEYKQRLQSSVLNNQAVMLYLSITDDLPRELQEKQILRIHEIFSKAIEISKINAVALLNRYLLEWSVGILKDEEFQQHLQSEVFAIEPELAKLMYILFKKNIQCHQIDEDEFDETLQMMKDSDKIMSNLTKYLFDHHEFMSYKAKHGIKMDKESQRLNKELILMKNLEQQDDHPHKNILIKLNKSFKPQGLFFSNNDYFVGIVGIGEIQIHDSRTGRLCHTQTLPAIDEYGAFKYKRRRLQNRVIHEPDSQKEQQTHNKFELQVEQVPNKPEKVEPSKGTSSLLKEQKAAVAESISGKKVGQAEADLAARSNENFKSDNMILKGRNQQDILSEGGEESKSQIEQSHQASSENYKQLRTSYNLSNLVSGKTTQHTSLAQYDTMIQHENIDNTALTGSNNFSRFYGTSALNTHQHSKEENVQRSMDITPNTVDDNTLLQNQQQIHEPTESNINPTQRQPHGHGFINIQSASSETIESGASSTLSTDSKASNHQSYSSSVEHFDNDEVAYALEKERAWDERKEMQKRFPSIWMLDIRNNGKMFAIFDKAQQERNKHWKYKNFNQSEMMFIYNIVQGKCIQFGDNTYKLDLSLLLKDQEVLNFGFDDYNESFSMISVQAKDLFIYHIDFISHSVIRKLPDRHSVLMKSIFYNPPSKDKPLQLYEFVKEFVQDQEAKGHTVLLPKMNEDIIIIKELHTNLIKIYSIKHRRFVRQFSLSTNENFKGRQSLRGQEEENQASEAHLSPKLATDAAAIKADQEKGSHEAKRNASLQEYGSPKRGKSDQDCTTIFLSSTTHLFLGKSKTSKQNALNTRSSVSSLDVQNRIEDGPNQIGMVEVSPKGRFIVAQINDDIFLRVIHLTLTAANERFKNSYDYQQAITFMPIYFDQDYNYHYRQFAIAQDNSNSTVASDEIETDAELALSKQVALSITAGVIDKAQLLYKDFLKLMATNGTNYQKNEKIFEMLAYIDVFIQDLKAVYKCPRKKYKFEKIEMVMNMLRHYPSIDASNVSLVRFRGIHQFHSFERLNFLRSFEYIKCFAQSSSVGKSYCAVIVNRKLQLYNYVTNKLIFEINMPNASYQQHLSSTGQCAFLDHDKIIAIKDGDSRIAIINIEAQVENYGKNQVTEFNHKSTKKIETHFGEDITQKNEFVNFDRIQTNDNDDDKESEESEQGQNQSTSKNFIDYDLPIEYVATSRSTATLGYLAILTKQRFTIYSIYDDQMQNAEVAQVWDNDIRTDPRVRCLGKLISLDFENKCKTFITGTNLGWVCIWNLEDKELMSKFQIRNEITKRPDVCNLLRDHDGENTVLSYSNKTMNLYRGYRVKKDVAEPNLEKEARIQEIQAILDQQDLYLRTKKKNSDKMLPEKKLIDLRIQMRELINIKDPTKMVLAHDTVNLFKDVSEAEKYQKGIVVQIQIDVFNKHMFLSFKNNYVEVLEMQNFSRLQIYGPFSASIDSPIVIDDYCTYIAHLDDSSKHVKYHIIDYEYACAKLPPLPQKNVAPKPQPGAVYSGAELKSFLTYHVVEPKARQNESQKSQACNIF